MWQVQATISREWTESDENGISTISMSKQIPTFFLDEQIQGILSPEGAMRIAQQILDPFGMYSVSGIAVKL